MSQPKRRETQAQPAKRVAFLGLLFATAMALSFVEMILPVLPMLPPGFKLGLSNIVTMYALFTLGPREGITIAVLKSGFVFLTRGLVSAVMSLSGGVASVVCMLLAGFLLGKKQDYLLLSVLGATAHNGGQIIAAIFILGTLKVTAYLPVVLLAGFATGMITGKMLQVILPYINRLHR